jgi:hypothetical protein
MISPAQLDTLKAVLKHKRAIRVQRSLVQSNWVWSVGGVPRSGTIDRLLMSGHLEAIDRDTLKVSERGRRALGKQAA